MISDKSPEWAGEELHKVTKNFAERTFGWSFLGNININWESLDSVLILSLVIISVSCFFCLKMCERNRQVSRIALFLKAEGRLFDGDWKRIISDRHGFALVHLRVWFFLRQTRPSAGFGSGCRLAGSRRHSAWLWLHVPKFKPLISLNAAARHTLTQQGGQKLRRTTQRSASCQTAQSPIKSAHYDLIEEMGGKSGGC